MGRELSEIFKERDRISVVKWHVNICDSEGVVRERGGETVVRVCLCVMKL